MLFEIHGLILALHYEARFLQNPGSIERAIMGFRQHSCALPHQVQQRGRHRPPKPPRRHTDLPLRPAQSFHPNHPLKE
jgi:hypothetical protein